MTRPEGRRYTGARRVGAGAAGSAGWRRSARDWWPLAAVVGAVMLLVVVGVVPAWPGAVQLVALPPLDHFADLRILLTEATSVPAFVALLVLVLAVRVVVLALLTGGLTRRRLGFAALFYGVTSPLLLLIATVDFASYAVLYSRTFWGAMTALAVVVLISAALPWQHQRRDWWRGGFRLEVVLPYAAVLIGVGAAADLAPEWVTPLLVSVSAGATGLAAWQLRRPPPRGAVLRLATVAVLAAVVAAVFVTTRTVSEPPPAVDRPGSLLLMSGINSSSGNGSIFEADVVALGYDCDQVYYFSYAGAGDGQPRNDATCDIRTGAPYGPEHTLRPVDEQVAIFSEQVRDLPRPLVVAGHSLAAWIAWEAVAGGYAPEVDVLVLVGPFPDSPVGYPPAGADGPGRVAGDLLRTIAPIAGEFDFHFQPDAPAARQLLATPNAAEQIFSQPLPPSVRALSIPSATDLPLMPGGWRLPVDRDACPVREAHPYLPETPAFYQEVNRFLDREPPLSCPPWRDWGAPAARPFGVPPAAARGAAGLGGG